MEDRNSLALVLLILVSCLLGCWQGSSNVSSERGRIEPSLSTNSTPASASTIKNTNTTSEMNDKKSAAGFKANLPQGFEEPSDDVGRKLLREYGSMFVVKGGGIAPVRVVFKNESDVAAFQGKLQKASENISGFNMELQAAAMEDLRKALTEAKASGFAISPRGADSAKRTYNETVGLWASRVEPALKHWVGKGKLTQAEADRIKALSPYEQVSEVLKLEEKGLYFAKDLSKSIIYSVAPPGTSQHLTLLALDVTEHDNARVRELLAKHKWFQTVVSDLPHFTYLGVPESDLPGLGLKKIVEGGRTFWLPDL
jgi:hypothetical protein